MFLDVCRSPKMANLKLQLFQLHSVVHAFMDIKTDRKSLGDQHAHGEEGWQSHLSLNLQPRGLSSLWGQHVGPSRGCGGTHLCCSKLVSVVDEEGPIGSYT